MLDMDIKHSLQFVIVHFGSEIITKAMNNRCHAFELGTMGTNGVFKGMHGTTLSGYQDILHSLPYHTIPETTFIIRVCNQRKDESVSVAMVIRG